HEADRCYAAEGQYREPARSRVSKGILPAPQRRLMLSLASQVHHCPFILDRETLSDKRTN
ncbi:MAG: hypothetical protein OES12_05605, partial [Anaerolineae bacterium]|nr:hypothetical protein [Anaerolineae bacterium]